MPSGMRGGATTQSSSPQMAMAAALAVLAHPRVTTAMATMMSTDAAAAEALVPLELDQLMRDHDEPHGDGREGGMQHGEHGHRQHEQEDEPARSLRRASQNTSSARRRPGSGTG